MSEKECSVTLYPYDTRKCLCHGTGLIEMGDGNKSFCPTHKIKRKWPQLQSDGTVKFREMGGWGLK